MTADEMGVVLERLAGTVEKLSDVVDRMERTISGAPDEGNSGILPRLSRLEVRVERLMWTFPILILGGTALGQVISRFLGL